jgi:hypothetical protein
VENKEENDGKKIREGKMTDGRLRGISAEVAVGI